MNLDTVSFTVTAPGAGPTVMTAVAGDSVQIRNGSKGSNIVALAGWCKAQAVGLTQILWPSGPDLVRGNRWRNVANQTDNKINPSFPWRFRAQDPLTVSQVGSAVAGDLELVSLLMFYEDLPGVDAHMINVETLRARGVNAVTVEDTVTSTGGGAYSGARALNAASDLLQADTEYAIVGATLGAVCQCITVRGVDTGNLRVAIPGLSGDANITNDWFTNISNRFGTASIPVINSSNRAGIFIECLQDENLTAVPFSLNLVELKQ